MPANRDLGRVARRERWLPRYNEEIPTLFSTKKEADKKKLRTDIMLVDEDPDRISFVRVTEERVQVKFLDETSRLTAGDRLPPWIKWHIGGQ